MPIMTFGGFKRMTGFCKTAVPKQIAADLEAIKDNEEAVKARRPALCLQVTDNLVWSGSE